MVWNFGGTKRKDDYMIQVPLPQTISIYTVYVNVYVNVYTHAYWAHYANLCACLHT